MSFLESIVHFDILKFVSSYMIISDAMTVIGFLKHYGLDKDYKVLTCSIKIFDILTKPNGRSHFVVLFHLHTVFLDMVWVKIKNLTYC